MQQRERASDFRVPRARQPAGLLRSKLRDVAAERFDKERFGKLREDGVSARARSIRLPDRKQDQLLQPGPGLSRSDIHFENRWKSREKHPAQLGIAGQESTHESSGFA